MPTISTVRLPLPRLAVWVPHSAEYFAWTWAAMLENPTWVPALLLVAAEPGNAGGSEEHPMAPCAAAFSTGVSSFPGNLGKPTEYLFWEWMRNCGMLPEDSQGSVTLLTA